ncbi:integrase catalytic domain-containing protein [Empedobacter falsenii]
MFEYQQNILCVASKWLWENEIISEGNYKKMCSTGKIKKVSVGGNGRRALVAYESIPDRFKTKIKALAGDPYEQVRYVVLADYIEYDLEAEKFYKSYLLEDGSNLPEEKQKEYTHQATIFNAVNHVATNVVVQRKFGGKAKMWSKMLEAIQNLPTTWLHTRYKNELSFKRAFKKYLNDGYEANVSGKFLNTNTVKITGDIADFLLAQYCLPIKYSVPEVMDVYNEVREKNGWKSIAEKTILTWLNKPEQMRKWYAARHGKDAYMKKYGHSLSRDRSDFFPNSWWSIDGTKLDWVHYEDNKQKMAASMKIDVVFDVYSEKIIGWDIAFTENHAAHFRAIKQAVNVAGARPYLLTYDNQSGHKSSKMQDLYDRLMPEKGTHYPHMVGRKTGSPAEQIFNRLQQQVIGKMWFSDKQSIKVRKEDNKPNTDFLIEFKGALPTKEELWQWFELAVIQWNSKSRRDMTICRNDLYAEEAPFRSELDYMDQMSLFWLDESKPKKYYGHGMPMTVEGKDYLFEVYDENGQIDMEFRRNYVGEQLIVRYDPEQLDQYIALYKLNAKNEKVFVAYAEKKRTYQQIPVLMKEHSRDQMLKDIAVREDEFKRDLAEAEAIMKRAGVTVETMIEDQETAMKFKGHLPKEEQMQADIDEYHRKW